MSVDFRFFKAEKKEQTAPLVKSLVQSFFSGDNDPYSAVIRR